MKIIDLLNKIANEDIPKKIKYSGVIYEYDYYKGDCGYVDMSQIPYKWFEKEIDCDVPSFLNEEVKIIEEKKEIEKLDVALLGQCDNWLRCPTNEATKQDVELNPYIIDNIRENTLYFQRKINELIDAVNELKKEK